MSMDSHPCLTCVAVLKLAPADEDALRCKALVLIELENFESALLVISTPALEKSLGFEKVRTGGLSGACMIPNAGLQ